MDTSTKPNMDSLPQTDDLRPPRDWDALVTRLLAGATVVLVALSVLGIVGGGILFLAGSDWSAEWMLLIGWLLAAVVTSALCAGVALLARLQRSVLDRTASMDQRLAALAERSFAQATGGPPKAEAGSDLVLVQRLLADIREIMLLPEEQKAARFHTLMQAELRRRLAAANQLIDAHEFHRAREELASLADRFGTGDDLRRTEERLLAATQAALTEDVETATRKVADLMAMARWEHAEQYARELTQKYPDSGEPRKLLARVREERVLFDRRHRQRMHDEIQQFVHQRRWREAASAAEMFIQTFPQGVDTDALRQQLDTLKANAEIEIRQQLERHIKEYLARKDYWDALELARRIIAEYPFSPQANVLRTQLPRLEELARQQGPRA